MTRSLRSKSRNSGHSLT